MKTIYLACPYTHDEQEVMLERTKEATRVAAELMMDGYNVFSPLTHSHPISEWMPYEYQTGADFWIERDLEFMKIADELFVLCLDGWKESTGVAREIQYAQENDIPIIFMEKDVK